MKTRILAILLALLLSVGVLTACGGNRDADVHVFYYTFSDTYVSSVRGTLGAELGRAGFSYQDYDGNGNQTTQTEQIRTAITKGAKALLVNIVNTGSDDAAQEIVNLAKDAGIPLIFFNREVSDTIISSYENCAYVGTRAEEAGILQGEMIGEYLVNNYDQIDLNNDGVISYILFKGEEGNNEAIYRTKYSVEKANEMLLAAGKPALRFYDPANQNGYHVDQNGQWSSAAANNYMNTALASYNAANGNMIELVICNNDSMAEGAISALDAAGFNKGGSSPTIPVFGVDATEAAKTLIKDGKMVGTIQQDAAGMSSTLSLLTANALDENKELMSGTENLPVDEAVRKIRIPYAKYLG
ncbi:MAG: galactose ABC transporter substrate-binding protein [Ruminococcaceae bacterium]|nr:galactose ABC transporter substrate-binding protein [Oscillospiraceae bacterium]